MLTKVWDLAYEVDGDNIELEQDAGCGEVNRMTLHRMHLRHLAEVAGLIPASAHANPDQGVSRLGRQLRALHQRIKHLDESIWAVAGYGREDLDHECTFSSATLDLADEFVTDLDALAAAPTANPPKTAVIAASNTPECGGVQINLLPAADGKPMAHATKEAA